MIRNISIKLKVSYYTLLISMTFSLFSEIKILFPEYLNSLKANISLTELSAFLSAYNISYFQEDIDYLYVPWTCMGSLSDLERNELISERLSNLKLKNGVTVIQSPNIIYEQKDNFKKIGIKYILSPNSTQLMIQDLEKLGITVIPFPHATLFKIIPKDKDLLFSFIGLNSPNIRNEIYEKYKNFPGTFFHMNEQTCNTEMAKKYCDVLSKSRFALCPKGLNAGSFRFWESLQAGSIPILISDSLILPSFVDWDAAIIKINENEIDKIPVILSKISIEQESRMRDNCIKIFNYLCKDRLFIEYFNILINNKIII